MNIKTPEQIARYAFSGADNNSLTVAIAKRIAQEAIEADRAQREHPMSDPLIELREWCDSIRPHLYGDKGNDWSEELAQLDVIEERLDGEA